MDDCAPESLLTHQHGDFVRGRDDCWIYGSGATPDLAAQSFDSRYWGAITGPMIRYVVR